MESQPTLFAEGSHASPFPSPGSDEARRMTAISGRKWRGSYPKSGPVGCLLRTLLESTDWRSTEFFLTWKGSATKQRRRSKFRLAPSMPRTSECGSGSWATPVSQPAGSTPEDFIRRKQESVARGNSMGIVLTDLGLQAQAVASGTWPTPTVTSGAQTAETPTPNQTGGTTLEGAARASWPTPGAREKGGGEYTDPEKAQARKEAGHQINLSEAALTAWATPTSRDYKHSHGPEALERKFTEETRGKALTEQAAFGNKPNGSTAATASAGALNPEFVCWLQGFPSGWLNLEPSATPSSRKSSKSSGER